MLSHFQVINYQNITTHLAKNNWNFTISEQTFCTDTQRNEIS